MTDTSDPANRTNLVTTARRRALFVALFYGTLPAAAVVAIDTKLAAAPMIQACLAAVITGLVLARTLQVAGTGRWHWMTLTLGATTPFFYAAVAMLSGLAFPDGFMLGFAMLYRLIHDLALMGATLATSLLASLIAAKILGGTIRAT